jgi:hypothetical protein
MPARRASRAREVGVAIAMFRTKAEQVSGNQACAAGLHGYSGGTHVDAVVTAFVLAATRALVSAGSIGRPESSAMRSVRACGDLQVSRHPGRGALGSYRREYPRPRCWRRCCGRNAREEPSKELRERCSRDCARPADSLSY